MFKRTAYVALYSAALISAIGGIGENDEKAGGRDDRRGVSEKSFDKRGERYLSYEKNA